MMTRDQAIKFMMENPEAKVTHRFFSSDEYLYMVDGICYDEMGYIFDDGTIHHDGLQMRKGDAWETDWDIYNDELERSPHEFKVDDIVMHFKREKDTSGNPMAYLYKIISLNARDTSDYERQVIYEALYNSDDGFVKIGDHFVRPYDEFMDEVNHDKYPDIKQKYRFEIFQEGRKW